MRYGQHALALQYLELNLLITIVNKISDYYEKDMVERRSDLSDLSSQF